MNLNERIRRHRVHLAHQRRELYEFNIDLPCPCAVCKRDRFEYRVTVALFFALSVMCGAAAVLIGGWP